MTLSIERAIFEAMLAYLKLVYPLEGCGLLAGKDGRAQSHYPVENQLHSPTAYEMEPGQLIAAFMAFEAREQTLSAIYHSHPDGPAVPSTTDVIQANYPDAVQIIVSLEEPDRPEVGAFRIIDGRVSSVTLTVV